jgi:hypothetical protein
MLFATSSFVYIFETAFCFSALKLLSVHYMSVLLMLPYRYDTADDNIRKKARQLAAHSTRDYMLLKTYLRLIDTYRRDRTVYLPIENARRQLVALRAPLSIAAFEATPPFLGHAYFCAGCNKWASVVERPLPVMHTIPAVKREKAKDGTVLSVTVCSPMPPPESAQERLDPLALAYADNGPLGHAACLRAGYYDPLDGQLYCRSGYHMGSSGASSGGGDEDEEWLTGFKGKGRGAITTWARAHAKELQRIASSAGKASGGEEAAAGASRDDDDDEDNNNNDFGRLATADLVTCKQPLCDIDMVGVWHRLHNQQYGLCEYCGRLTEVIPAHMTNLGLQCGRHALTLEYPDYHRLWASQARHPAAVRRAARESLLPPRVTPCFVCREPAVRELDAYDCLAKLFRVPLCVHHVALLHDKLPLPRRGSQELYGMPPVAMEWLLRQVV